MKQTHLLIEGTYCASCEVLLERRLRKIPGVTSASVDYSTGKAKIETSQPVSHAQFEAAINKDGYQLIGTAGAKLKTSEYVEIGALLLIFIGLYVVLKQFHILPSVGVTDTMGLGLVFVIGLIAGTSTCLAVTGGLLLALTAKYSESRSQLGQAKKLKPTLYFATGRILGYGAFGAALGALGSFLTFSPSLSGIITIIAATIMIVLGLQLLRIVPFLNRIKIRMPKFIAHRIYDQSNGEYKPWAPFVIGASTFFVPCGFTQALQFYVLAKGSALTGGLTMLLFALGTLPMLLAVGAVSSLTKGAFHAHFIRAAAVLIILLGIFSFPAGIALMRMAIQ